MDMWRQFLFSFGLGDRDLERLSDAEFQELWSNFGIVVRTLCRVRHEVIPPV